MMANKSPAPSEPTDLENQVDVMMQPGLPPEPSAQASPVLGAPTLPNRRPLKAAPETVVPLSPPAAVARPTDTVADGITVKPLTVDTAQSDAAIDDIVAQEADEVLAAEDATIAAANEAVNETSEEHGHPIFWFIIVLIAIVAIFAAVVLVNPNLQLPFSR